MPAPWKDGDHLDRKEAKEATKRLLRDESKKRPKGHPDDELTRDDPVPDYAESEEDE